jgi:hypothetical protein
MRRTRAGGRALGGTGTSYRWCCPAAAKEAQMDGVPYSPVQIHQVRKRDAVDRSFGRRCTDGHHLQRDPVAGALMFDRPHSDEHPEGAVGRRFRQTGAARHLPGVAPWRAGGAALVDHLARRRDLGFMDASTSTAYAECLHQADNSHQAGEDCNEVERAALGSRCEQAQDARDST